MSDIKAIIKVNDDNREKVFSEAYDGSYYTVIGCGGDLGTWTTGYSKMLKEAGIGEPRQFITFKGGDMNFSYGLTGDNAYSDDLTFIMFPLDGLDVPKLAIFRLREGDKWFDDIVDNNQRREEATSA
ncbi:MAG: hypothetical protein K2K25_01455 [Muribaculaceae bacterium]|nr:hypothetical protein [Muribaculaceae bacterium]